MGARFVVAALLVVAATGCAHDTILPVDSVCGDGQVTGKEECDNFSPGCVECKVLPGWKCQGDTCATVCGDGQVVGNEQCDPPNGVTCDSACQAASKAEACDMTGWWISRETDFSIDEILSQTQTSSNWYLYHLSQTGDSFHVVQAINCGIHITGTVTVDLTDGGRRGLSWANDMSEGSAHGPRVGTFKQQGGGCAFSMNRWYNVRGVEESLAPADFNAKPDLSTLTPLPHEDNPQYLPGKPHGQFLAGAVDTDGNGFPGVLWKISGNANGERDTAQRDWNEYFPDPAYPIPTHAIEFSSRCNFANEENILHVSQCPALGCGLLLAGSHPANKQHRVTFRYLGKDLSDPRVAAIVVAPIRQNMDDDQKTCANLRASLPHDPAKE